MNYDLPLQGSPLRAGDILTKDPSYEGTFTMKKRLPAAVLTLLVAGLTGPTNAQDQKTIFDVADTSHDGKLIREEFILNEKAG
ncbi:hypothetical protein [Pseudoxanthomonas sp. JBR18]|uniref:hypothetical protein n=1 Tax=Pseudoxanthomonas sp. JBR18 TaxID=2969308 RepID=UPI0023064FE5|nr:hypothetical protein [Pseudoxanthomonas sp. JBR18]WCE02636.1 hypothetical protein PJ250_10780 [Pseudoxanthomonas sp. JBR18]